MPREHMEHQPHNTVLKAAFANHPPVDADSQRPTSAMLLWAYCHGIFPMADPDTGRIDWFSPDPRAIFPLHPPDAFHIPRNVAREVRKGRIDIRYDTEFEQVMRDCAVDRDEDNRCWINDTIIAAYCELHRLGFAHSVEAWLPTETGTGPHSPQSAVLVGGLYGVSIGGAFFGESMFSRPDLGGSNSSKVCLVHLVNRLRLRGYTLLDTQFWNEHIAQFGCIEIPADEYLKLLHNAVRLPLAWT